MTLTTKNAGAALRRLREEGRTMYVEMLRETLVKPVGGVVASYSPGAIIEVSEETAAFLIGSRKAAPASPPKADKKPAKEK